MSQSRTDPFCYPHFFGFAQATSEEEEEARRQKRSWTLLGKCWGSLSAHKSIKFKHSMSGWRRDWRSFEKQRKRNEVSGLLCLHSVESGFLLSHFMLEHANCSKTSELCASELVAICPWRTFCVSLSQNVQ